MKKEGKQITLSCGATIRVTHLVVGGSIAAVKILPKGAVPSTAILYDKDSGGIEVTFWRKDVPELIEMLEAMLPDGQVVGE